MQPPDQMAGTTGLEPATSDVTGRRLPNEWTGFRSIFSSLRGSWSITFRAATVRATVPRRLCGLAQG